MITYHSLFNHLVAVLKSNVEDRTGGMAVFVSSVETMKYISSTLKRLGFSNVQGNILPIYWSCSYELLVFRDSFFLYRDMKRDHE